MAEGFGETGIKVAAQAFLITPEADLFSPAPTARDQEGPVAHLNDICRPLLPCLLPEKRKKVP